MIAQNLPEYYPIELFHWSGMSDNTIYMIEDILSLNPEYINCKNKDNDNSLMIASRMGNIEIVKYFLEKTNIDFKHANEQGDFFMIAIKYGHKKQSELIFTNFIEKINTIQLNSKKETVLHLAALKGYDFIFENSSFLKNIKNLDINNKHCLFHLIEGYPEHLNYWCFELIQECFSIDFLLMKNKDNENILDYIQKLIHKSLLTDYTFKIYEPILNILNQRIEANI